MVFLCIACIVLSSIALHGITLHRIAWHCMVLQRLHGVVQIIWRAGELPRSASSHFFKTGKLQYSCQMSTNNDQQIVCQIPYLRYKGLKVFCIKFF